VQKRNKHTKKNCAPIWFYLQDYTSMHGQQNIKFFNTSFGIFRGPNIKYSHNKPYKLRCMRSVCCGLWWRRRNI